MSMKARVGHRRLPGVTRIGEDGKPYIAVVALSVASKNQQAARKLEQLNEEVGKAEDAYNAACDQYGDDTPQARAALEAFEKLKAGLVKFLENHPELK
jgi:single-stranded DNA-specific DHH superfamily exonuclease